MRPSSPQIPVIGIIVAAGQGTRLGEPMPKAFVSLRGQTLLERSIRSMVKSEVVDEIIVVISPDMENHTRELLSSTKLFDVPEIDIQLVHGGVERTDSVKAGLSHIEKAEAVVLIHDSARALTPPALFRQVAAEVANGVAAVIPVLPVVDTIKQVNLTANTVVATPHRDELRAVQTPQGFSLSRLRTANQAFFGGDEAQHLPTDDASVMEWFGEAVRCIPGDSLAFKITTPRDLVVAEAIVGQAGTEKAGEFHG